MFAALQIISTVLVALAMATAVAHALELPGKMRLARENLRATQVIQEKFETIRLYTWDQINDPKFIPNSFTNSLYTGNGQTNQAAYIGTVRISRAGITEAYADDLRLVTIQLNWTSGSLPRTRTMTSFVARYGLQNYIY